jgi:hypothetical protein
LGTAACPGAPVAAPPDLAGLVLRARAQLTIEFPGIEMSPPVGKPAWVQLPVWLWLPRSEWHDRETKVSDGPLEVTITAKPVKVTWDMGNGAQVICDGPGKPYDYGLKEDQQSSECSHTYTRTSADQPGQTYHVTASMEWSASYTSTTGARGVFEPIVLVGSVDLTVGQIQALIGD